MEHKGTDGFGREYTSEVFASFCRDGKSYVTCWVAHADEFRTFETGECEPYGDEAYEQLTADEQSELFAMLVDEAADRSSRDVARDMLDGMPLSEMREYLDGEEE